jgi:hypothetical protein
VDLKLEVVVPVSDVGAEGRPPGGPDPERGDYGSFASFSDPDGNGLLLHEGKTRARDADGTSTLKA